MDTPGRQIHWSFLPIGAHAFFPIKLTLDGTNSVRQANSRALCAPLQIPTASRPPFSTTATAIIYATRGCRRDSSVWPLCLARILSHTFVLARLTIGRGVLPVGDSAVL